MQNEAISLHNNWMFLLQIFSYFKYPARRIINRKLSEGGGNIQNIFLESNSEFSQDAPQTLTAPSEKQIKGNFQPFFSSNLMKQLFYCSFFQQIDIKLNYKKNKKSSEIIKRNKMLKKMSILSVIFFPFLLFRPIQLYPFLLLLSSVFFFWQTINQILIRQNEIY